VKPKQSRRSKGERDILRRAEFLAGATVKDLRACLWQYISCDDLRVLGLAWNIATNKHEPTKAAVLARRIRRVRKDLGFEEVRNV
jgi:hypothetical protein